MYTYAMFTLFLDGAKKNQQAKPREKAHVLRGSMCLRKVDFNPAPHGQVQNPYEVGPVTSYKLGL